MSNTGIKYQKLAAVAIVAGFIGLLTSLQNNTDNDVQPESPEQDHEIKKVTSFITKTKSPQIACNLLNKFGLSTGNYKHMDGDEDNVRMCFTPYKEIGSGFPLANNVAYYVTGTTEGVYDLEIVLNINNPKSKTASIKMIEYGTYLYKKVTGTTASKKFIQAIKSGVKYSETLHNVKCNVFREEWADPSKGNFSLHIKFSA